MNTEPEVGRAMPVADWLLLKERAKSASMPITSPVDFISGPSVGSTPRNLMNGSTTPFVAV